MTTFEFIETFQETLAVIAGGLVGYLTSFLLWHKSEKQSIRLRRSEHIERMMTLALRTGAFARSLSHVKVDRPMDLASLGPDPVDELMTLAILYVHEAAPIVQEMHFRMQALYAFPTEHPDAARILEERTLQMGALMDQLKSRLAETAYKEKLTKDAPDSIQKEVRIVQQKLDAEFGR